MESETCLYGWNQSQFKANARLKGASKNGSLFSFWRSLQIAQSVISDLLDGLCLQCSHC